jgi:hypothetical protein
MIDLSLHPKQCINEFAGGMENLVLLSLFFSDQPNGGSLARIQKSIFMIQNRLNNEKIKNFNYVFIAGGRNCLRPYNIQLSNDIKYLIDNEFLKIKNHTDIVITEEGKKIINRLASFFDANGDFVLKFMQEVNKINSLTEKGLKLLFDKVKIKKYGGYRNLDSIAENTKIQEGLAGKSVNGLKLTVEDVATIINLFSKNLKKSIDESIEDMLYGIMPLLHFSTAADVRTTQVCQDAIDEFTNDFGVDTQGIVKLIDRLSNNLNKYKIDLRYALEGCSSILVGKYYLLTVVSCKDCLGKGPMAKLTNGCGAMCESLKDKPIILIAFQKIENYTETFHSDKTVKAKL